MKQNGTWWPSIKVSLTWGLATQNQWMSKKLNVDFRPLKNIQFGMLIPLLPFILISDSLLNLLTIKIPVDETELFINFLNLFYIELKNENKICNVTF